MKTISHTSKSKDKLLHIETDLGIINIRVGLTDTEDRRVESIEIIRNNYAGEPKVILDGYTNSRLIEEKGES
jgi:hypothetical protein